jgi:hypothetical protein
VAELPLDDHQRDPFAGHLDGVGVAELVGREPALDAGRPVAFRSIVRIPAGEQGRPRDRAVVG